MSIVKTDFTIKTNHVIGFVVVGVAGYVLYTGYKKAGEVAKAVVSKVNPASADNFIYSGVSAVGSKISGDKNWNLGGWIYDITHPGDKLNSPINTAVAAGDRLIKLDNKEGISE